jgi:Astacin (Peptidase family M12A)
MFSGDAWFVSRRYKAETWSQKWTLPIWPLAKSCHPFQVRRDFRLVQHSKQSSSSLYNKIMQTTATDIPRQNLLVSAMRQIMAITCIRFEPAQASTTAYIVFTDAEEGCWAHLGHTGRRQSVNLAQGCHSVSLS